MAASATPALGCKRKRDSDASDERKAVTSRVIPGPAARAARDIRGTVIGPGTYLHEGNTRYVLSLIDLDGHPPGSSKPQFIPLSFHGHGVSIHPLNPNLAVIFQKQGPGACEVDLRARAVTRPIPTVAKRWFYGHGAWSNDGQLLYATETVLDTGEGVIAVRDGRSLDIVGEFRTHGAKPHDCVLVDSGRVLAITNGGTERGGVAPSVTYVDVASQKLLERVDLPVDYLNTGHLTLSAAGDLAVVSAQREGMPDTAIGGVSLRPAGGALKTMTAPRALTETLVSESLSVTIHEPTGIVGVTTPKANLVTFWNLAEQRFVAKLGLPSPRGIGQTLDNRRFLISYGPAASLVEMTVDSLKLLPETRVGNAGLAGSHFITHEFPG